MILYLVWYTHTNMPRPLQYITYINPMRFAIEAIRRIYLEGAGLSTVAPAYVPCWPPPP